MLGEEKEEDSLLIILQEARGTDAGERRWDLAVKASDVQRAEPHTGQSRRTEGSGAAWETLSTFCGVFLHRMIGACTLSYFS